MEKPLRILEIFNDFFGEDLFKMNKIEDVAGKIKTYQDTSNFYHLLETYENGEISENNKNILPSVHVAIIFVLRYNRHTLKSGGIIMMRYQNPELPIEERVEYLLARMTLL